MSPTPLTPTATPAALAGVCYIGDAIDPSLGIPTNLLATGDWGAIALSWNLAGDPGNCVVLTAEWAEPGAAGFVTAVIPFGRDVRATVDGRAYPPGANAVFYTLYVASADGRSPGIAVTFARPDRSTPPSGIPGAPHPMAAEPACYVGDAIDPGMAAPTDLVIEGGWTTGLRPRWAIPSAGEVCFVLTATWVDEFRGIASWTRVLPATAHGFVDLTPYPANGQDIAYVLYAATRDARAAAVGAEFHAPIVDFTSPTPSP